MSDVMISTSGQSATNYLTSTAEGQSLFNQLKVYFPDELIEDYTAVSEPYIHEVLGKECVRTCVSTEVCLGMLGVHTASAHRMFVLDTGESFFLANKVFTDVQPSWKPEESFVLTVMEPYAEYKNDTPDGYDRFREYFLGMRPAVAVHDLGVDPANASTEVVYSVLVDSGDNILAVRSYLNYIEGYGSVNTMQDVMSYLCSRIGKPELASAFIDGNYVD